MVWQFAFVKGCSSRALLARDGTHCKTYGASTAGERQVLSNPVPAGRGSADASRPRDPIDIKVESLVEALVVLVDFAQQSLHYTQRMIIAVDETIPYWEDAFSQVGTLHPFSCRQLHRKDVRDADALVVRSTTRVDAALLEGSSVRFVGTASIGMDHLDQDYLQRRGIYYANAAGSNAIAVAEYVMTALFFVSERHGWELAHRTLAVIGVGHVGSRVEAMARALGMEVRLCDPPLAQSTGDPRFLDLEEVMEADAFTFHVPLTCAGPYPTHHMVGSTFIDRLSQSQFLFNTSRGRIFDSSALKDALRRRKIAGAVLDVWEGEPGIDYSLLDIVDLGTPHIAGFSLDGKILGTEMILEELGNFFNIPITWNTGTHAPKPKTIRPKKGSRGLEALRSIVLQAYPIAQDDAGLRGLRHLGKEQAALGFDSLRDNYLLRSEFKHFVVELPPELVELRPMLEALGFQIFPSGTGGS